MLSASGIFRSSLSCDSPSAVSSASVATGKAELSPIELVSLFLSLFLHFTILYASLNDASNSYDVTVVIFANACCLLARRI